MRLTLVSDAWMPQVNGVVRTLTTTVAHLEARGHVVQTITPDRFVSVPCPTYPEIRLALTSPRVVGGLIAGFRPEAVHIATEGPLGWLARGWCVKRGVPFTTSFHTRFPDYVAARTGLSPAYLWRVLARFHASARNILVATPRLAAELAVHGLIRTRPWSRGVDLGQFHPEVAPPAAYAGLARPIMLSVGRVAVELGLEHLDVIKRNLVPSGAFPYKAAAGAPPTGLSPLRFHGLDQSLVWTSGTNVPSGWGSLDSQQ